MFLCGQISSPKGRNVDLQGELNMGTDATLNISTALTINTWHHVVMTWTDDGDDEITLWIDGISRGSSSDGVGPLDSDANNLLIGGDSSNNFDGQIDDFRVYNYALTAAQIKTVMQGGAVRF